VDINWHSEPLTLETKITRSYKTTQNVRRFFKAHTDEEIHFSREFMAWMKSNVGKTLQEAIENYKSQ
jgi:hypothetical protein